MANVGRKLGVNIRTCMQEANISLDSFAKHLGYSIKDVWNVIEGKVIIPPVELDKIAGEPIDVLVNGKYVAKGEVVVIEESFGIRITEIVK